MIMFYKGVCLASYGVYRSSKMEVSKPFKDHYIGKVRIKVYCGIILMLFIIFKFPVKRDDDPDAAKYIRFRQNPKY